MEKATPFIVACLIITAAASAPMILDIMKESSLSNLLEMGKAVIATARDPRAYQEFKRTWSEHRFTGFSKSGKEEKAVVHQDENLLSPVPDKQLKPVHKQDVSQEGWKEAYMGKLEDAEVTVRRKGEDIKVFLKVPGRKEMEVSYEAFGEWVNAGVLICIPESLTGHFRTMSRLVVVKLGKVQK